MKSSHVYKENPLNPLNPLEESDRDLKRKKKKGREGLGAETTNPRNPLDLPERMSETTPAYVDWREVRHFNPRAPRYMGPEVRCEFRAPAIGKAMAREKRMKLEEAERHQRALSTRASELLRGNVLFNLHARGTLDDRMLRAALHFRESFRWLSGGVGAADFMREKVDGGRVACGAPGAIGSALDAERRCRDMLALSQMGAAAAEVVWLVAGLDCQLKVVAIEFEDTPARVAKARRSMRPSKQAQDYVRRLLRQGLRALADHLYGRDRRHMGSLGAFLADWLMLDISR